MYNVISQLKRVSVVELYDKNKKQIKTIPFKNVSFNFIGSKTKYKFNTKKSDHSLTYNNISLSADGIDKMYIFQDYGDGYCSTPTTEYKEIPRELLLQGNEPSIGYCNGSFVYIIVLGNAMLVYELFDAKLPSLTYLRHKRPYSFSLCAKDNKVYYYLTLNCDEFHEFFYDSPFNLSDILSLENVSEVLKTFPYSFNIWDEYNDKYITRDILVMMGFSYNHDKREWSKNGVTLIDQGPEYNPVFEYNGDYIIEVKELRKLLNETE